VKRWERFDLDFPDDFPVTSIDALHAHLSDRQPNTSPKPAEWSEWATALNGVAYRFIACDEAAAQTIVSLSASDSPPQPERARQENNLFSFYTMGLSILESLSYGIYFVGALADPAGIPSGVRRRDVTPSLAASAFADAFPHEPLTMRLNDLVSSDEFKNWSLIRHALSHRGAPGRTFYEGGGPSSGVDWNLPIKQIDLSQELLPATIEARRIWLGARVAEIVDAAATFALANIP
jgi:hypothetical protein